MPQDAWKELEVFEGEWGDRMRERIDTLRYSRPQLIAAVKTIQAYLPELAKRLASELENNDAQVADESSDGKHASGASKSLSLRVSQA